MTGWERELDKKLKGLPSFKAPSTLLPAVMNRVEARTRWAWWAWPLAARVSSLLGLAAGAAALDIEGGRLLSFLSRAPWTFPARALNAVASAHNGVSTALGRALWELLAAFGQPLLIPAGLAYVNCAAGAVIVWQLSLRPRHARHI